ncbi:MAG: hypothetical protein RBR23_03650 [Arcobacteraceae bacterium]|jgi:hypothetical protein|nr:hypothetical protein [Arcobacteraceae bacterium]
MSAVLEYIKQNNLDWQPSFNGELKDGLFGYRGSLIVEAGKQLSPDRILPPKIQAKQVIMVTNDKEIEFFACELESFEHFAPMFEKYKDFFSKNGKNILFVIDLNDSGTFEYEGVVFNAYVLDESSVWNETLDMLNLEKNDLKKASPAEKIEAVYDEAQTSDLSAKSRTYDEMTALKSNTKKVMMGAV